MRVKQLLQFINRRKLDWSGLSANANAITMLENNPEYIDWSNFSFNTNAIRMLEQNLEKVN